MKILFVTDNFYPEKNAPAIRTYEHSLNWLSQGHEVTILTSNPNFPKGKIFKGYKNKFFQREKLDDLNIIRVWTFMTKNDGFFLRILDHLSFGISSIISAFFIKKHDVIIGTSPQFFTVISCSIISFLRKTPWVFELRDLWPDSIMKLGLMKKNDLSYKLLKKIEIFLYNNCAIIIPVTYSFEIYLHRLKIDKEKIMVITNGINLNLINPIKKNFDLINKYNLKNKFVLGYFGTHGLAHGLNTILNVIKKFNDHGFDEKIIFFFIGEGSEKNKLISFKKKHKLNNAIFLDNIDRKILKNYWSILDISLIHLKKIDIFMDVIPSKLFESMGMNIPILLGVDGESRKIIEKFRIGEYFEPENEEQLFNLIIKFYYNKNYLSLYKKNARSNSHHYDRKILSKKMISFIEKNI